jgi:predicted transcriptional regulator
MVAYDTSPAKEHIMAEQSDIDTGLSTVELATELTVAWLSNANNRITADDVPAFLQRMHDTVSGLSTDNAVTRDDAAPAQEYTPAVSVRKSLASRDHIISMIDGKPYKTLRRHLATNGMTPDEYRDRYGLKADYPMVAPSYSESRSAMAKTIGLGRKPVQTNTSKGDGNSTRKSKAAKADG